MVKEHFSVSSPWGDKISQVNFKPALLHTVCYVLHFPFFHLIFSRNISLLCTLTLQVWLNYTWSMAWMTAVNCELNKEKMSNTYLMHSIFILWHNVEFTERINFTIPSTKKKTEDLIFWIRQHVMACIVMLGNNSYRLFLYDLWLLSMTTNGAL